MVLLSVMVTACRPACALAVVIFARNQFVIVMPAISARMQQCGSGGSGLSVVVRAV